MERKKLQQKQKNAPDFVNVIGAGLAGCEAAYQLVKRGVRVKLYEMRPGKTTPAHKTGIFAELVCSNSLRAQNLENAVGLLKREMQEVGSLIMEAALATQVPAGGALAVDREGFSRYIMDILMRNPYLEFVNKEVVSLGQLEGITIIATGPLTSDGLSEAIKDLIGQDYLYFYDAAAPLISYDSLDKEKVFFASRYDKGDSDYINCPMNREEYLNFYHELINAQVTESKNFEKHIFFEGCMPVEEMARRGVDTLRYGPLKPVGLIDPKTGEEAYAVVQLRQDNNSATIYNMVGFQTHLKWPEQKRVFGMIPGLAKADFLRYGVMHRNTFINSPLVLTNCFALKSAPDIFFAGQITGVEGYVESAASGLIAGWNAARGMKGYAMQAFPEQTALGSLASYVSNESVVNFQPMNINFGIMPKLEQKVKGKKNKNTQISAIALQKLADFWQIENINIV